MALDYIDNHIQRALSLLREQYKGDDAFKAQISIFVQQIQDLEDILHEAYTTVNIENAFGKILDDIGENHGEYRRGVSDEEYRRNIYTRIAINNGGCDPEFIITTVKKLTNAVSIQYTDLYPANYGLNIKTDNFNSSIIPLIQSLSPAGVGEPVITVSSTGSPFVFSEVYTAEYVLLAQENGVTFPLDVGASVDTTYVLAGNDIALLESLNSEGFGEVYLTVFVAVDETGATLMFDDNSPWRLTSSDDNEYYTTSQYGGEFAEVF
jgi:hypothetical protein